MKKISNPNDSFRLGVIFAVVTGLCWAILAIALKYALHFASTGTIVWIRMVFAFSILLFSYSYRDFKIVKRVLFKPPIPLIFAGLFLAFNYFGYMSGLELTSASNAQIMIQLGPLTLLFIGVFYFKEQLRWVQWLGILIAAGGFCFYNWDQLLVNLKNTSQYIHGNFWLTFAALSWAIFAAIQKNQFKNGWSPQMINFLIYGVCCLALFPTANITELYQLSLWQWFVLFLLGLNTVIAYGAFGEALQRIPASSVSLIVSVNPLLTIGIVMLMTYLGLDFNSPEPILWRGYLGAALVVLGVAIAVSLRAKRTK